MGCDYYWVKNPAGYIHFSDMDDSYGCLCTFPYNYSDEKLYTDTVRSLALLGAALVLVQHDEIDTPAFLPYAVPDWIREEIDRILNYKEDENEKDT